MNNVRLAVELKIGGSLLKWMVNFVFWGDFRIHTVKKWLLVICSG